MGASRMNGKKKKKRLAHKKKPSDVAAASAKNTNPDGSKDTVWR